MHDGQIWQSREFERPAAQVPEPIFHSAKMLRKPLEEEKQGQDRSGTSVEAMGWIALAIALVVSPAIPSQIPAGTVIPVMLSSSLNTIKDVQGKRLEGSVMQDVFLPSGERISRLSRVIGHVMKVTRSGPTGSRVVLQFDAIKDHGKTIALTAGLLALASQFSVWDAQAPISMSSDVFAADQWATRQVGGDIVRRDWRKVGTKEGLSGRWLEGNSVLIKLTPNPDAGCASGPGYDREQALWVFSSAACGTYGLSDVEIASSGDIAPLGQIVLASSHKIAIRGGSGWLLMVVGEPKAGKSQNDALQ